MKRKVCQSPSYLEIVEDFHEIESDHEPVAPVKQKPLKELVGKVVGRSDQPKYKGVIEVK